MKICKIAYKLGNFDPAFEDIVPDPIVAGALLTCLQEGNTKTNAIPSFTPNNATQTIAINTLDLIASHTIESIVLISQQKICAHPTMLTGVLQ